MNCSDRAKQEVEDCFCREHVEEAGDVTITVPVGRDREALQSAREILVAFVKMLSNSHDESLEVLCFNETIPML